jgi:hypothetical protein
MALVSCTKKNLATLLGWFHQSATASFSCLVFHSSKRTVVAQEQNSFKKLFGALSCFQFSNLENFIASARIG